MTQANLNEVLAGLPTGSVIGDIGSGSKELQDKCKQIGKDFQYIPADKSGDAEVILTDFDSEPLPFPDDYFDLVVSSHVLEHLKSPIVHFAELIRVCKKNGLIYIETPSERSTNCKSHPFSHEKGLILNFYDDPTHIGRPWSAQSLFRLGVYYNLDIKSIKYDFSYWYRFLLPFLYIKWLFDQNSNYYVEKYWKAKGWVVKALYKKSFTGTANFNYFSFKGNKNGHYK